MLACMYNTVHVLGRGEKWKGLLAWEVIVAWDYNFLRVFFQVVGFV